MNGTTVASENLGTHSFTASGAGVFFGGSLDAHFTPPFAFSTGVSWSVGDFSTYKIDNQDISGRSISATSARISVRVIWFPMTSSSSR